MKKTIICGMTSLAMAAAPVLGASAEGPADLGESRDVTVGEVDETVYSVDINWGDMAFDWKYNAGTNDFNFEAHPRCDAVSAVVDGKVWLEYQRDNGWLFSNDTCSEQYSGEITDGATYYASEGATKSTMDITDNSTNGRIKASASFASEDKYNWVDGVFGFMDSGWDGPDVPHRTPEFVVYTDGVLPFKNVGGNMVAHGELELTKNSSYVPGAAIEASDKIGTVTINIEPDLE